MSEIVEGLGDRERIRRLLEADSFFWIDASTTEASPEELKEVLHIPEDALVPLLDFDESTPPSRKFHAEHVVFAFACFLESGQKDPDGMRALRPSEVHVLVHGSYLLTVHRSRTPLPKRLHSYSSEGRTPTPPRGAASSTSFTPCWTRWSPLASTR